jgi:hypothetical protein
LETFADDASEIDIAQHEATHAVVACLVGVPFTQVTITSNGETSGAVSFVPTLGVLRFTEPGYLEDVASDDAVRRAAAYEHLLPQCVVGLAPMLLSLADRAIRRPEDRDGLLACGRVAVCGTVHLSPTERPKVIGHLSRLTSDPDACPDLDPFNYDLAQVKSLTSLAAASDADRATFLDRAWQDALEYVTDASVIKKIENVALALIDRRTLDYYEVTTIVHSSA